MGLIYFGEIKKIRSTEEHNELYTSDCNVAGTYVPNMSMEDNCKWKGKHIKGSDERVEIRRSIYGTQVVIIVYKKPLDKGRGNRHENIQISANSKIHLNLSDYEEFKNVIEEAKSILGI